MDKMKAKKKMKKKTETEIVVHVKCTKQKKNMFFFKCETYTSVRF